MFDPRLTVRLWGLRLATRVSCVVVLGVVVGGVLSRLAVADAVGRVGLAIAAVVTGAVVTALVLGHEATRVWAWRRLGGRIGDVDLALFGGATDVAGAAASPRGEALGAIAAFVGLVALAAAFELASLLTRGATTWLRAPVKTVAIAALALVALQAMPALHLDGGRVFHAWCWYLTDSPRAATHLAVIYAHLVALALLGIGVVLAVAGGEWPYWGLAAAVAGLQLEGAARRAVRRSAWPAADPTLTVGALALAAGTRVPSDATVDQAVEWLLAEGHDASLFVVADGAIVGALRMAELRGTRRSAWDRLTVGEVMRRLEDLPSIRFDQSVAEALTILDQRPAAVVRDEAGQPVTLVNRTTLLVAVADRDRHPPGE
jgi:hypothetical protein